MVIVTGIRREVVGEFRGSWMAENTKRNVVVKECSIGSFSIFQFGSFENAFAFKKYVRAKKVERDLEEK